MREAILVVIMMVLCPIALFRPKIGLYGYTWFALLRPDYLAWSAGEYPYSLALAVCTLLGAGPRYISKIGIWFRDGLCQATMLLTAVMGFSVLTAYWIEEAWIPYNLYIRLILMAMLIPLMIQTLEDLRLLMLVIAFSMGFLGFRFGFYGLIRGGARYDAGYGGFLADNNCVALALVMVIPLCWYSYQFFAPRWAKWGYLVMGFGSFTGVVWTHSRGGAIALALCLLAMVMRSKRKIGVFVVLCLMALPAVWLAKDTYLERLSSITDYETEASALSRLALAKGAIKIWIDHPITGVGFGSANFQRLISNYLQRPDAHVAHNTYLQIAADSGTPALIIYLAIMFGTMWRLGQSAARMKALDRPDLVAYPVSLQLAILAFAVGSTFLSRVTFDFYYILIMTSSSWFIVEKGILKPTSESQSLGWGTPITAQAPALNSQSAV
jgi:putative inorganic carbon (hco3(-)) transporter